MSMNNKTMKSPWNGRNLIGIDLGGTKTAVALVREGEILRHLHFATRVSEGAEAIIDDIVHAVHALRNDNAEISSIGIAVAGQVERLSGHVLFAPNLRFHELPLKQRIEEKSGLPCFVCNDVRAATLGEWCCGAARECANFLCLFLGTGIGAGMVNEGELLEGGANGAGEVGHMLFQWRGRRCSCGGNGCWEAYAGGWGLSEILSEKTKSEPTRASSLLHHAAGMPLRPEHLSLALADGDSLAREIYEDFLEALGAGSVSLLHILNPEKLLLGGGLIEGFPQLVKGIETYIHLHSLAIASKGLQVLRCHLGGAAPLLGAALVASHAKTGH